MRRGELVAASFLALGFAFISVVALVVEPRMGLSEVADRFDPATVFAATTALTSIVGNLVMFGFGVALAYLAVHTEDGFFRAAGFTGAFGFFLLGCLGQVAARIPGFISDPTHMDAAVLGLLSVRLGVLQTSVFCLGVVAWRSTRNRPGAVANSIAWRGMGVLVLAACTAFLFVGLPVPPIVTVWATWYVVRLARDTYKEGAVREGM